MFTVIPGRDAVASPESITTNRGYGFRPGPSGHPGMTRTKQSTKSIHQSLDGLYFTPNALKVMMV